MVYYLAVANICVGVHSVMHLPAQWDIVYQYLPILATAICLRGLCSSDTVFLDFFDINNVAVLQYDVCLETEIAA